MHIINPYRYGGGAYTGTLLNGLVSWWDLDEASGTRFDSHTANDVNDLTDNNTVTQATGKVGNAAQFTAANLEHLSKSSASNLGADDRDFTWAQWIYLDSLAGQVFARNCTNATSTAGTAHEWLFSMTSNILHQ